MIAYDRMIVASPIMWKSKQIECMCHSSKDAETLAMSKLLDEVTYIARQLEILLFGDYRKRMPVRIMTDSEPILESIASTKQIERVCHSSKDAETLTMSKLLDEVEYIAQQLEILLFRDYRKRIPVRIMTDSEPTLESIASTDKEERIENDIAGNERKFNRKRDKIVSVAIYNVNLG